MVALVLFGFYPAPLLDVANPTVESLLSHVGVGDDEPTVSPDDVPAHSDDTETEGAH